jgi:hypothetical protein
MIRPIESNLSLYTVDIKAHQAQTDAGAPMAQAAQQDEIARQAIYLAQTVQKTQETEGEVKIRDQERQRERGGGGKRGKRGNGEESDDAPELAEEAAALASDGHLNFLA